MKKLRSKKGFTLIELIVVIAILGILATIAIPRFSGFTDKAKVRADDQYVALYKNAIVTLAAEGELTALATGAKIELDSDGNPEVTGLTGVTETDFTNLIKVTPLKKATKITIAVNDLEGNCTVTKE